jgi:hypothetical protein
LEGHLAERSGAVFRLAGLIQRLEDETVAVGDSDGLAELTSLIEGPGELALHARGCVRYLSGGKCPVKIALL